MGDSTGRAQATATQAIAAQSTTEQAIDKAASPDKADQEPTKWRSRLLVVWTIVGAIVLTGVLIYLLNVLALPVSMVIWTVVIIFCLRGIVEKLESKGLNRLVGTTISYVIMFVFIAAVGFLMFSPMFGINDQFANLISNIPSYIDGITKWLEETSKHYSNIMDNETVRSMINSAGGSLSSWASSFASDAAHTAVGIGTGIANMFYAIGFAMVIAFWILLELPAMGRETRRVIGPKYAAQGEFFHVTFTRILGGYIKGTLIQCLIIGVACGILFAVIGIPDAPALGVITGVLNIIPIIGPWLGGAVTAITAVFASPLKAIIALVGTIVIQQIVYTFISPKIMQNSVDIHPVMTLIAMVFGSAIGGAMSGMMGSLVGMLLAIPAVAVMKSVFIFYFERRTGRQIVGEDGFLFKGTPSENDIDPLYDATGGHKADAEKVKDAKARTLKERVESKIQEDHAKLDTHDDRDKSDEPDEQK